MSKTLRNIYCAPMFSHADFHKAMFLSSGEKFEKSLNKTYKVHKNEIYRKLNAKLIYGVIIKKRRMYGLYRIMIALQ
uniref:Uncharacterized protein n=1 Tax=Rhizophagus irregularis (strain DAOM 181602 / DAOM 197198 / MUCL 43194) TaxID=747089 RepID=U9UWQ7_RHIID